MVAQEFGADIPLSRQSRKTFEGKKNRKLLILLCFKKKPLRNYETEKEKGYFINREAADLIPVLAYLCMSTAIL